MTKIDMLFVRACKSKNPINRIYKIHKKFYCLGSDSCQNKRAVIGILSDIIEGSNPLKTLEGIQLALDMNSVNCVDFNDKMIEKLSSRICNTKVSNFDGFITPCSFK